MSILPAIPVLLLGVVCVWFVWPILVDPLTARLARPRGHRERDRVAEHLFDRWSKVAPLPDADRG